MTTTRFRGSLGFPIGYSVFMAAAGVTALVLTWRATGSLWWALLALLVADRASSPDFSDPLANAAAGWRHRGWPFSLRRCLADATEMNGRWRGGRKGGRS